MGTNEKNDKSVIEHAGEDLFNFAIEREDIKSLVASLHKETKCRPETVEYELQLLKIIITGWAVSFTLANNPHLDQLAEIYWKSIHEFSGTLSETTRVMTGSDIDYFQVLKDRVDVYVSALSEKPEATDPAAVIGPVFAGICGNTDDVHTVMSGSKMFISTISSVGKYLERIERP